MAPRVACELTRGGMIRRGAALTTLDPEGRELVETRVGLGLGLPLEPGVNALWCVSGALGFAALERTLGGPLCFADEAPEATATLAEVAAARDDAAAIAERYYVAAADRWGPELDATIRAACLARFGREPSILAPAPGLFAYSQVHVRHRFAQPFDRSTEPLLFAGDFVHAFGLFWFADDDPRLDACMVHAPYHDEPDEVWARGWIVEPSARTRAPASSSPASPRGRPSPRPSTRSAGASAPTSAPTRTRACAPTSASRSRSSTSTSASATRR